MFFELSDIFHHISSLLIFFIILLIFFRNFDIFIKKVFLFYHKKHALSFMKIYSISTHYWKEYAQRSNILIIFVANEISKILFIKKKLIRYCNFINIYIVYQNKASISMKLVFFNSSIIKLYNSSIYFYTWL